MNKKTIALGLMLLAAGCSTPAPVEKLPFSEPAWVREGEPIILENKSWYPLDVIENFTDDEVVRVGEYKSEPIYVERRDVKPYDRLYMKIDSLTFRAFRMTDKEKQKQ